MSGGRSCSIADALARYHREPSPPEGASSNPFKLVSAVETPAAVGEVEAAWRGHALPSDAVDLWAVCREGRLFEDVDHGQWSLALPAPSAGAARTAQEREARPSQFRPDDVVLAELLGDQELLVLASSESKGAAGSDRASAG